MKLIYKYNLGLTNIAYGLPVGYKLLHAGEQRGQAYIWCEVDPDVPLAPSGLLVLPTGMPVPEDKVHFATFFMGSDNELVWHVYAPAENLK